MPSPLVVGLYSALVIFTVVMLIMSLFDDYQQYAFTALASGVLIAALAGCCCHQTLATSKTA